MSEHWRRAVEVQRKRLEGHIKHLAQDGRSSMEQQLVAKRNLQVNDLKKVENLASVSAEELKQMRILEIGGLRCVTGALFTIKTRVKIAMDPLIDLWHRYDVVDDTCDYICGVGEGIPLKPNSVDLCWCANVIDHVSLPLNVLREIRRVLSNDGKLVISCNVYSRWARPLFPIFDRLDGGHPHHFTAASFRQLLMKEFDIQAIFPTERGEIRKWKELLGVIFGLRSATFQCIPRSQVNL